MMQKKLSNHQSAGIKRRIVACACLSAFFTGHALADDKSAASTGTGGDQSQLEEVIVTAEKKSENVQRAPVAVTSVAGDALVAQGIDNIRSFQTVIVNSNFERQNDFTEFYVRGIGQNQDSDYIDSGTAIYFNDMYTSRGLAATLGFYDLSSAQLLPGPQGTLYGRNAVGGAILVSANRPTDKYETSSTLELGNYSSLHATGVQNVPLSNTLSVRVAADVDRHSGFLSNGADDLNAISARVGALYKPSDTFSIYAWATDYYNTGAAQDGVPYPFNFSNPYYTGNPYRVPAAGSPVAPGNKGSTSQQANAAGAELNWRVTDDVSLTYIPTWFHYSSDNNSWILFFPFQELNDERQVTQELRLANDGGGKFNWVAGLYYLDFPSFQSQLGLSTHSKESSYAGYGNLTYSLTDHLRLTGGLRYSNDGKTADGVNPSAQEFNFDHDWTHVDWKIGLAMDVAPASLLYANVQTGYLEGTFLTVPNTQTFNNLINPETVLAFTVGSKNRFLDNRLQLNDEAFYYKLKDLQLTNLSIVTGYTLVANSNVTIYGDELSLTGIVTDYDQVTATIGYLSSTYDNYPGLAGQQTIFAPDMTANLSYQHIWPLAANAYMLGRVDTHYSSSFWGTLGHAPDTQQPGYTKTDLSLAYYSGDGKWNLGAYVKNVENSAVWGAGNTLGPYVFTFPQAPRTFGVRFRSSF
jgi:iron complex outermembrane receptor protein